MRFTLTAVSLFGLVAAAACSDIAVPPTALAPDGPSLAKAAKITICHAAGRAGTTHYIAITVSANATAGHFNNNGTPKAGHELDYIATPTRPCNAPEAGQIQVCVNLDPGGGGDAANPVFNQTLTVKEKVSQVLEFSQAFTSTFAPTDYVAVTKCSDVVDVAPATYQVDHPAPGAAEVPMGTHNGEWYIIRVAGTIGGSPTVLASNPADGVSWTSSQGRGQAGTADVPVQSNALSVVTFYDHK